MEWKHVTIMGAIGIGKSNLTDNLAEFFTENGFNTVKQSEDVSKMRYLDDYYRDMRQYAFRFQIDVLSERFRQQKNMSPLNITIQDGSIYSDLAFMGLLVDKDLIDRRDYETYLRLHKEMISCIQYPSLVIYLKAPTEILLDRIKHRGRQCEKDIDADYLNRLCLQYEIILEDLKKHTKVVQIDWSEFMNIENLISLLLL